MLPDDFVLSDRNMAQVQQLLPNRNGKTMDHALWPGAASASEQPGAVPWQQDKSYWPDANANPVITVWIPLVDSTPATG